MLNLKEVINVQKMFQDLITNSPYWTEIRYHYRQLININVKNGKVHQAESKVLAGAGVRCLIDGCWGFVATSDVSKQGLKTAIKEAGEASVTASKIKKNKIKGLALGEPAAGNYVYTEQTGEPSLDEKIKIFLKAEAKIRENEQIVMGSLTYSQYDDRKIIVNSDGADARITDIKRDIGVLAVARNESDQETGSSSNGVTGSWDDLFARKTLKEMVEEAIRIANQNLTAEYAPGGKFMVILDPMLVGVLAHEAIGHTVEADFVLSGSIVQGKLGEKVASELVTLIDDGTIEKTAGMVLVDDEGTRGEKTTIIDRGILKNYLHNRESAYLFNTEPHGNARAFTYRDEPIIRMTNTYILQGEDKLDDMIRGVKDGFYLKGLGQGGQADASAEFMFGVKEAFRIKNGEIKEPVKGITISGQAFEVLQSVDAVSDDMEFALGRGYCGKFQPAKVDAGGPYLRCQVTIGGQQPAEEGK